MKLPTKKKSPKKFFTEYIHHIIIKYLAKNSKKLTSENMGVFSKDFIGFNIILNGTYESEYLDILIDFFKINNVNTYDLNILDIGANIGNHSFFFSKYFKKVIGFEPNPKLFKMLELNTYELQNVSIYNFGISNKEESRTFTYNEFNYGEGSLSDKTSNDAKTKIYLKTLDQLQFYHSIDVIKLDIEGHEYEALIGAEILINEYHPFILFEQLEQEINNGTSKCIDLLKFYGYKSFYSIEKKKYSSIGKLNILISMLRGLKYEIKPLNTLEKKDYTLIIAI